MIPLNAPNAVFTPIPKDIIDRCRSMIRVGSKSFAAASLIFNKDDRAAASLLYGWCRYCDDAIDEAAQRSEGNVHLLKTLEQLRSCTENAFNGIQQENPVFEAIRHISHRYQIPRHYAFELLEGMAMDVRKAQYETLDDLMLYCYRVAGVVGLMMSHIMGVRDVSALRHASDMGSAMQLTNIARDVYDDAEMGRIYLPLAWLREAGLSPELITSPLEAPRLAVIIRRLLREAEKFYRSGDDGLNCLRFRPAVAVAGARFVYSEIGKEVWRRGENAWLDRVWIPGWKKVVLLFKGFLKVVTSVPLRILKPWRPVTISTVWRFS